MHEALSVLAIFAVVGFVGVALFDDKTTARTYLIGSSVFLVGGIIAFLATGRADYAWMQLGALLLVWLLYAVYSAGTRQQGSK